MVTPGLGIEYQILAALTLDLLVGDPRWLPHPVKIIGHMAVALENPFRRLFPHPRFAGIITAFSVIALTGLVSWGVIMGAAMIHPLLAEVFSILLLYLCFAARDLAGHAMDVHTSLNENDLPGARQKVSRMVGRDTAALDETGVARATVESVAENTVDGVAAPLFFAVVGGPVAAMVYKAISTLDSTFGYKDERYREFGWASARMDDLANFIPARLMVLLIPIAAALVRLNPASAFRIALRDGKKHASPNSGLAEAAFAGALGVQLGGPVVRAGQPSMMPTLGYPLRPIEVRDILRAVSLMFSALAVLAVVLIGIRLLIG